MSVIKTNLQQLALESLLRACSLSVQSTRPTLLDACMTLFTGVGHSAVTRLHAGAAGSRGLPGQALSRFS